MNISELKSIVQSSDNIVFFGGAGTSTESGIPDFRSQNGLFQTKHGTEHPPEQILSHPFFMEHTGEFYRFYKDKMIHPLAMPNAAHLTLAALEAMGSLRAVITQNIDGLHQQAGSKTVLELHGSIHRNSCMGCGTFYTLDYVMETEGVIPHCARCKGIIKPDVVLYQEGLDEELFADAAARIAKAEVLIVAGTSLSVYPAAGLVDHYKGNHLLLINKSTTRYDGYANYVIHDSIGKVLASLIEADE
jgi:NAD-dependent deacetylase